jgi:hypothetical protein
MRTPTSAVPAAPSVASDRLPLSTLVRRALAADTAPSSTRPCPYCCTDLPREARKCRACGEWVVRTSAGTAPALLRVVGWLWVGGSLLAGGAIWIVGRSLRFALLLRDVDPAVTPVVFDVVLYGLVGVVVLQGVTIGLGAGVLARLAPRRPRWWT